MMWHHEIRCLVSRRGAKINPPRRRLLNVDVLECRALMSAGVLDTSFGGTGMVTGMAGKANAVLVQPADGKLIVAGFTPSSTGTSAALARYNPDGTLDNGFGSGGQVVTAMGPNGSWVDGAAIQSDGKIVVAGSAVVQSRSQSIVEFALARYTTSGTLDTTFGGGKKSTGIVLHSFGSGRDEAHAVSFETVNGATKIVVAGWTNGVTGHPEIALARYNSDGSLDTSFGGTGTVVTSIPGTSYYPETQAAAVQSDGKIVVAGLINGPGPYPAFLARYNVNGSLDTSFGNNGVVISQFTQQDEFYGVTIQSDGKIVAVGDGTRSSNSIGEVARYNPDGTLDTTFAGGSGVYLGPATGSEYFAVALQTNGQIVAAGVAPNFETLVSRFNTDGSPDTTYGSGGSTMIAVGQVAQYNAVAIQPSDGEAVAAGFTSASWPSTNFLVARYTASASLPSSRSTALAAPETTTGGSPEGIFNPVLVPVALDSPDLLDTLHPITRRRGAH